MAWAFPRLQYIQEMKTSSWVIVNKATKQAVFETFNQNTANAINTRVYEVVPILQYLQSINATLKAAQ
jgi:hypothetical protein